LLFESFTLDEKSESLLLPSNSNNQSLFEPVSETELNAILSEVSLGFIRKNKKDEDEDSKKKSKK